MTIDCDVVIVGAGAAGGVLAATLAERRDLRVVLLEKGGYFTGSALAQNELAGARLHAGGGGRQTVDGSIHVTGGECVGGGTQVNYALSFDPVRARWERWSRELGLSGFSFEAGDDYGIAGLNMPNALADIRSRLHIHRAADAEANDNNRLFARGARARGVSYQPYELNMRDCIGCGFCGTGCAYDRKMSTAVTYVPDALSYGAQLVHHCDVNAIVFESNGGVPRAVGVRANVRPTVAGSRANSVAPGPLTVTARLVIVSAGTIETPALLQRSHVPDPFDRIGRGLILHPSLPVGGIFDHDIVNYRGITGVYYSDHYYDEHGFILECLFDHPVDTAVAVPDTGRRHFETMRAYRRLAGFGVMLVDSVSDENRVQWNPATGSSEIRYRLTESDKERLRFGAREAAEIMFAAGAREVFLASDEAIGPLESARFTDRAQTRYCSDLRFEPHQTLIASAHAQSTVKMGADPARSVADARGEVRHTRNLIACDSSSFPTSCGVNPMISIMTLARYQGRRIAGEWPRYA